MKLKRLMMMRRINHNNDNLNGNIGDIGVSVDSEKNESKTDAVEDKKTDVADISTSTTNRRTNNAKIFATRRLASRSMKFYPKFRSEASTTSSPSSPDTDKIHNPIRETAAPTTPTKKIAIEVNNITKKCAVDVDYDDDDKTAPMTPIDTLETEENSQCNYSSSSNTIAVDNETMMSTVSSSTIKLLLGTRRSARVLVCRSVDKVEIEVGGCTEEERDNDANKSGSCGSIAPVDVNASATTRSSSEETTVPTKNGDDSHDGTEAMMVSMNLSGTSTSPFDHEGQSFEFLASRMHHDVEVTTCTLMSFLPPVASAALSCFNTSRVSSADSPQLDVYLEQDDHKEDEENKSSPSQQDYRSIFPREESCYEEEKEDCQDVFGQEGEIEHRLSSIGGKIDASSVLEMLKESGGSIEIIKAQADMGDKSGTNIVFFDGSHDRNDFKANDDDNYVLKEWTDKNQEYAKEDRAGDHGRNEDVQDDPKEDRAGDDDDESGRSCSMSTSTGISIDYSMTSQPAATYLQLWSIFSTAPCDEDTDEESDDDDESSDSIESEDGTEYNSQNTGSEREESFDVNDSGLGRSLLFEVIYDDDDDVDESSIRMIKEMVFDEDQPLEVTSCDIMRGESSIKQANKLGSSAQLIVSVDETEADEVETVYGPTLIASA